MTNTCEDFDYLECKNRFATCWQPLRLAQNENREHNHQIRRISKWWLCAEGWGRLSKKGVTYRKEGEKGKK